jgi:hypothetical protein
MTTKELQVTGSAAGTKQELRQSWFYLAPIHFHVLASFCCDLSNFSRADPVGIQIAS